MKNTLILLSVLLCSFTVYCSEHSSSEEEQHIIPPLIKSKSTELTRRDSGPIEVGKLILAKQSETTETSPGVAPKKLYPKRANKPRAPQPEPTPNVEVVVTKKKKKSKKRKDVVAYSVDLAATTEKTQRKANKKEKK